jgi:DNA-binding transcriptional ArsR family regulator
VSDDILEVERPEQLKALGHPLRLKVLQALGETEDALTNRELAARLDVDPGHLHFHVRMLAKAGLIEPVPGRGREKPYRPAAAHLRVGAEFRAAGLALDMQAAQLAELKRGFDRFASTGDFRTVQVHARVDVERLRAIFQQLIEEIDRVEDNDQPPHTIFVAFHPAIGESAEGSAETG